MENPYIQISSRKIGAAFPVYIVAELSANHCQCFETAVELMRRAKEVGADAVKLQTYTADTLTIQSDRPEFRIDGGTPWDGRTLYDLYEEAYMPWDWQPRLIETARKLGLEIFSTPFDRSAVDFLEKLGAPAYKIASFELVDIPLIEYAAAKGKPLIISTGMATLTEIDEAVTAARSAGASQVALLKCTSAYPAAPEGMNLRTIPHMAGLFHLPVGLSDHTLGITVPIAAVALGACIVEKHFTLSRAIPGPDAAFSLEPAEFKAMVENIRTSEKALGEIEYELSAQEAKSSVFRRSLFAVKDIRAGERFTEENVRSIRPGYGLHPRHLKEMLGLCAAQNIERGTPLGWELISGAGIHPRNMDQHRKVDNP